MRYTSERNNPGSGPASATPTLTPQEQRTGNILLEAASRHLLGPLVGRFGHMDQSTAWIKGAALWWNDLYRGKLSVGRWVINFEVGRDYTWSYRNQDKVEGGETVDEGSARRTYLARNTLLEFFWQQKERSFTSAEICRKFHKKLSFIPRSEFEPLLNMYVGKQYLKKEGNRFRIRESYTPVHTTERPQREEKLRRWYESMGPLSQSYLEGRGQLIGLHAKLPMPLWEEFQARQAAFIQSTVNELVEKSNSPEFAGSQEYSGGGFIMIGPYPWTLPHWEEAWKTAESPPPAVESKPEGGDLP